MTVLQRPFESAQYTSEQFRALMADNGVTCSMSRSVNVWERAIKGAIGSSPMASAAMESFFSTLKTERTVQKVYRSRNQARADVFDFIERFYNAKRRHSTIKYLSPMEFERRAGLS